MPCIALSCGKHKQLDIPHRDWPSSGIERELADFLGKQDLLGTGIAQEHPQRIGLNRRPFFGKAFADPCIQRRAGKQRAVADISDSKKRLRAAFAFVRRSVDKQEQHIGMDILREPLHLFFGKCGNAFDDNKTFLCGKRKDGHFIEKRSIA